jgi:site-specific DNA-methyltransferase (adenine-specific)
MIPTIPLASVQLNDRFRKKYDKINDLAASISRFGGESKRLIQPMVVTETTPPVLVAGGRRFNALSELKVEILTHGLHYIHPGELTPVEAREVELEENLQREDMTWQEKCLGIATVHEMRSHRSILEAGEQWLQERTGELLCVTQGWVSTALALAKHLRAGDKEIKECATARDALSLLLRRRENAAAELLKTQIAATPTQKVESLKYKPEPPQNGDLLEPQRQVFVPVEDKAVHGITLGDSLKILSHLQPASVDHIITDPPYGIDMDMLDQSNAGLVNIDTIAATHQVEDNQFMLGRFMDEFYKVLKPTGFCIVWHDATYWQLLYDRAVEAGFRVQRWPLIWVKTHVCKNSAAGFNFTKSTEQAIVCAMPNARLISAQGVNYFACSNEKDKDHGGHPFSKPLLLWQWLIEAVVLPGGSFLDPFVGRGSSAVAAIKCGRVPHGIEIDPDHYNHCIINVDKARSEVVK